MINSVARQLKLLGMTTAIALGAVTIPSTFSSAQAASFTYNLDCSFSGGACSGSGYWGQITFTDTTYNGFGAVNLFFDLVGPLDNSAGNKILQAALNYDDTKFSNADSFGLVGGSVDVTDAENALSLQGTGGGTSARVFDLRIPATGNLNVFDQFNGTLYRSGGSLLAQDLNFVNSLGVYAAVHIGNYSAPGYSGGDSITVGAAKPVPVPPMTMGIIAAGMFGVTSLAKKRKAQQKQAQAIN